MISVLVKLPWHSPGQAHGKEYKEKLFELLDWCEKHIKNDYQHYALIDSSQTPVFQQYEGHTYVVFEFEDDKDAFKFKLYHRQK